MASRLATGVTTFGTKGPSAPPDPASPLPRAASAWHSLPPRPSAASHRKHPCRRTGLPGIEGRLRHAMLAAKLRRLCPCLLLAQDRNDLLFRKLRSLYRPVLKMGRTLASDGGVIWGHSNSTIYCGTEPQNVRDRVLPDYDGCCSKVVDDIDAVDSREASPVSTIAPHVLARLKAYSSPEQDRRASASFGSAPVRFF